MRVLGGYRLERELGRGGMGVVHAALSPSGERCALKVLLDLEDEVALERFKREAQAARRLQHPNLIRVLDYGVADGHPYLVMPLVEGSDLRDRLRSGPLPVDEVARIGAALADGLAHAHALGILHRDLKPENVILGPGGPILTDFGLAKPLLDRQSLTQTGQLVGTPAYMAPEQARGDKTQIGVATDVYGLGALLYALLVGSAPFRGPTALMVLTQVMDTAPPAPSTLREGVPPGLEAAVLRCLAKEPSQRFEDMVQLRDALSGGALLAREEPPPEGGSASARRAILLSLAVVSLLFLGLVASGLLRPPRPEPSPSASASSSSPAFSPSARKSVTRQGGRYGRDALRQRLKIPATVNAVDFAYDQVVVQLSSPRALGLHWLEEGVELTTDPELRLAWALVLSQGLGNPDSAAPICSDLALSLGESPRLRVVRAFTQYRYADPAWVRAEMELANADPAAPRYAIGLLALTLLRENKLDAAIAIAEEGSRRGDPGSASVLATCHKRRAGQGSEAAQSEAVQAYARAEDLSRKLFGRFPIPWAANYAHILYTSGDRTKGRERFRAAIKEATWTARPAILFVEALSAQSRRVSQEAERQALAREIKDVLLLGATRTNGVRQTRQLLQHGEGVGARVEPPLRGLTRARLPLPLYERGERADLILEYLDQVGREVWASAFEDLNASIAEEKLEPAQRQLRLLARVRLRRRIFSAADERLNQNKDDVLEAQALEASGQAHDVAWAWVEFEQGGEGLEPALRHLDAALRRNPENWPRLVALRAEIRLYLGRGAKSGPDVELLRRVATQRHPAERSRRAKLCLLYLRGIHALARGKNDAARRVLRELNSSSPAFYRAGDALHWEGLCRARLGERRPPAAAPGRYLSEISLTLEALERATLVKERRDRDFTALEALAARWPGPSLFRRWALDLSEN